MSSIDLLLVYYTIYYRVVDSSRASRNYCDVWLDLLIRLTTCDLDSNRMTFDMTWICKKWLVNNADETYTCMSRTYLVRMGYSIFHSYTLNNSKLKTLYPWRIPRSKPFSHDEFQALKTFYPWRIPSSEKFHSQTSFNTPLKNSKLKTLFPWRIPSWKPFTLDEFHAQNPSPMTNSKPWKISISKSFTLEEFHAQNHLPLKNSTLKTLLPWWIQAQNPLPLKNSKLWKISISNLF